LVVSSIFRKGIATVGCPHVAALPRLGASVIPRRPRREAGSVNLNKLRVERGHLLTDGDKLGVGVPRKLVKAGIGKPLALAGT
jgi:hypothetical protein